MIMPTYNFRWEVGEVCRPVSVTNIAKNLQLLSWTLGTSLYEVTRAFYILGKMAKLNGLFSPELLILFPFSDNFGSKYFHDINCDDKYEEKRNKKFLREKPK